MVLFEIELLLESEVHNSARKHLLRESKLTLKTCVDICRASECTDQQLKAMRLADNVHSIGRKSQRNPRQNQPFKQPHILQPRVIECLLCGKALVKKNEEWPAWEKNLHRV